MQQQRQGDDWGVKDSLNLVLVIAQMIAFTGEIWLRRFGTWGDRHVIPQRLLGVVLMFSFFGYRNEPREAVYVTGATFVMLVLHRVMGAINA